MTLKTEYPAAKGIAQSRNLQPNGAASDNSQSLAEQFTTGHFAIISARTDSRVRRDNSPQDGNDQAEGQIAYRMHRVTCSVLKNDTASLARFLINVIDA